MHYFLASKLRAKRVFLLLTCKRHGISVNSYLWTLFNCFNQLLVTNSSKTGNASILRYLAMYVLILMRCQRFCSRMSSLASYKNGATTFLFILCILFRIGPASVFACNGECDLTVNCSSGLLNSIRRFYKVSIMTGDNCLCINDSRRNCPINP